MPDEIRPEAYRESMLAALDVIAERNARVRALEAHVARLKEELRRYLAAQMGDEK